MKPGLSIWLDMIRVIATFVVILSHWAYPRFTEGDYIILRIWNVGSDAVIVFFVVSGLVIAYAADRDKTLGIFAFNRLTRLWSVLIPAILLTVVFDTIGWGIDQSVYPADYYQPHSLFDMLLRGATFSHEFSFPGPIRLGTNGPLWSLSYEAAYYALFGTAVFLGGARRLGIIVILLVIAGPRIILLMPAWLMGAWVWRQITAGRLQDLTTATAATCAIIGPALYLLCQGLAVPQLLGRETAAFFGLPHAGFLLRFSDEFIWNAMIGAFTVLHVIGMVNILRHSKLRLTAIRWCAGASFSLYVTHYPALHLLDAALPVDLYGRHAILLIGCIVVGFAFAELFERRLRVFRDIVGRFRPQTVRP